MALALYRNYRPKRFGDVIGQDNVANTLRNQVAAGKTSHAYLFTGIRGTGKTTFARILAKAVNCRDVKDGEPCGVCEICVGIDNGSILDVTEIDGASNTGVDNIRELRDEAAYVPAITEKRVYIIDEVHMLSASASNALLKTLEEPPEHVIFILATTEAHRILATILSRCQRFDLKRVSVPKIIEHLMMVSGRENVALEPAAADIIARLSDGSVRDALSILDRCVSSGAGILDENTVNSIIGIAGNEECFKMAEYIANRDAARALTLTNAIYGEQLNPATFASQLMSHFRDLLMIKLDASRVLRDYPEERISRLTKQADILTKSSIITKLNLLKEFLSLLPSSSDRRLQLEICIIELCAPVDEKIEIAEKRDEVKQPGPSKQAYDPEQPEVIEELTPAEVEEVLESVIKTQDIPVFVEETKPEELPDKETLTEEQPENTPDTKDGSPRRFIEWSKVIEEMKSRSPMLHGFMAGSSAYLTEDRLLIDCGEHLKKQLTENSEYTAIIKEVVKTQTGVALPIGPYEKNPEAAGEYEDRQDYTLDEFISSAKHLGIEVEITE